MEQGSKNMSSTHKEMFKRHRLRPLKICRKEDKVETSEPLEGSKKNMTFFVMQIVFISLGKNLSM